MPIYHLTKEKNFDKLQTTNFSDLGVTEKELQHFLRDNISVISPDTLIIAEEFNQWGAEANRRIDLLGLDREGCIVVIELKRTEDGSHMELQALRYAAMVSTMTFEQAVVAYKGYLNNRGQDQENAEKAIREFLQVGDEPVALSNKVRIVLASANFSKEITTAVLWLNEQGLDLRCVRLCPYKFKETALIDVEQIIPLPETAAFQIAVRQKQLDQVAAQVAANSNQTYTLQVSEGNFIEDLGKGPLIKELVKIALSKNIQITQITGIIKKKNLFISTNQENASFEEVLANNPNADKRRFFKTRLSFNNQTYLLSNQWGGQDALNCANLLVDLINATNPEIPLSFNPTN